MSSVDQCANCGARIGKLETPYVWKDQAVCGTCYPRLGSGQTKVAAPSYGTISRGASVLRALSFFYFISAAILLLLALGGTSNDEQLASLSRSVAIRTILVAAAFSFAAIGAVLRTFAGVGEAIRDVARNSFNS